MPRGLLVSRRTVTLAARWQSLNRSSVDVSPGGGAMVHGSSRLDVARAAVLALLAGLIYVLSSGAHAYSVDEITNYASARALIETGSPDLSGEQPFPREQLLTLQHPSEDRATGRYGLLAWVGIAPSYLLARWADSMPPPASSTFPQPSAVRPVAALLYAPVIAALLVGATFLLGRNLGLRPRNAAAAALVLAVASPLWVYAKGLANIPLAALFSVLAFAVVTRPRPGVGHWAVAGGLAGLAALTRPDFVVLAPAVGLLSLFGGERPARTGLNPRVGVCLDLGRRGRPGHRPLEPLPNRRLSRCRLSVGVDPLADGPRLYRHLRRAGQSELWAAGLHARRGDRAVGNPRRYCPPAGLAGHAGAGWAGDRRLWVVRRLVGRPSRGGLVT